MYCNEIEGSKVWSMVWHIPEEETKVNKQRNSDNFIAFSVSVISVLNVHEYVLGR